MEKKITKLQVIEAMLGEEFVQDNETYKTYLTHEKELLINKRNKNSKDNEKKSAANKALTEKLLEVMKDVSGTATQLTFALMKVYPDDADVMALTNQKVTYLLKELAQAGTIKREEIKGKPIYSLIE